MELYKQIRVNQNIFLILENNHFTINHKINRKAYYVSYKEKTILLHDKLNKQGYNGKEYINIDDELLDDIRNFRTEYILVPKKKMNQWKYNIQNILKWRKD